jgi:hypothetical protein
MVFENTGSKPITLMKSGKADLVILPGERKTVSTKDYHLYSDPSGGFHMGMCGVAVEVDGLRCEENPDSADDEDIYDDYIITHI